MNLNWEELSSINTAFYFTLNCRERDLDIFIGTKPITKNILARKVNGKSFSTKDEIFKEFSSTLQFPYYFGNNWDAFDECMSDLSWLGESEGYVLFITNSENLKNSNIDDFIDVMNEVIKYWKNKNIFFKIIFQSENMANIKIEVGAEERELPPFDEIK